VFILSNTGLLTGSFKGQKTNTQYSAKSLESAMKQAILKSGSGSRPPCTGCGIAEFIPQQRDHPSSGGWHRPGLYSGAPWPQEFKDHGDLHPCEHA